MLLWLVFDFLCSLDAPLSTFPVDYRPAPAHTALALVLIVMFLPTSVLTLLGGRAIILLRIFSLQHQVFWWISLE